MFEWEDREYVNPRKKVFKNMDTDEILNLELQDDTDNILKESETPLNAHNLNLAQQELVDDMSKTYTGTNITAPTVAGYGRINKLYGHTEEVGTGDKSPDSPYKLECVGDDVNLFDSSIIQTNIATHKSDGTIILNGTLTSNYVFPITLGAGVYTFYEPTGILHTLIGNDTLFKNVKKTTIAEEKKFNNYILAGTYTNKIIKIKIQKYIEDREIKYSPYKYATVETISENDSNTSSNIAYINKPLCCIRDIRDEIDYTKGKIIRRCAEIILNGTESWVKMETVDNVSRFTIQLNDMKKASKFICDKLEVVEQLEQINTDIECIQERNISNDNAISIIIKNSRLSSVDASGFKSFLASNNIRLIYELETPVEEDIDCSNKIVQYAEETTVYNSDGAEIEVCLTNNKAISEVNEDLNNIENKLDFTSNKINNYSIEVYDDNCVWAYDASNKRFYTPKKSNKTNKNVISCNMFSVGNSEKWNNSFNYGSQQIFFKTDRFATVSEWQTFLSEMPIIIVNREI